MACMWPELSQQECNPLGFMDLGNGYLLLGPKDTDTHQLSPAQQMTLYSFCSDYTDAEDLDLQSVY